MTPPIYPNTTFSFLVNLMNENKPSLKRSRSTESIEQALKRVKPFQMDSPPIVYDASSRYPSLKSISISTRTQANNTHQQPGQFDTHQQGQFDTHQQGQFDTHQQGQMNDHYQQVNHFLLALHKERFGDPERRESWWKEDMEDVDMEESQPIYENANAILKQAFLQRRQQ